MVLVQGTEVAVSRVPAARVRRADGATIVGVYVVLVTVLPAKLVLSGVPLDLTPPLLLALGIGATWVCAQMISTSGVAKGRSIVRSALLVFGTAQLATYGFATFRGLPADELRAADRSLITILALLALGIAVCDGVRGVARVERLLTLLVAGATVMAAVGALQFLAGVDLTTSFSLPGLRSVANEATILDRSTFRRPSGTAGHPIEYGVVCALALPLALHFTFRARRLRVRSWHWQLCVVILGSGVAFSLSRSAILAVAVAGLVLFAGWSWERRLNVLTVVVGAALALRLAVPGLVGTIFGLFANLNSDVSVSGRTQDFGPAFDAIAQSPWLGRGFGTFLPTKYFYLDNQYLGTLIENGVIGLIALAGVLLGGMYAAVRVRLRAADQHTRDLAHALLACLAVPLVAAATFDLLSYAMITGLTFVLIGAAGALWREVRTEPGRGRGSIAGQRLRSLVITVLGRTGLRAAPDEPTPRDLLVTNGGNSLRSPRNGQPRRACPPAGRDGDVSADQGRSPHPYP